MKLFRAALPDAGLVDAPLLDAAEVAELAVQAKLWPAAFSRANVHDHHAGDWSSTVLGQGMDFEEARPYMPGDDLRDMDWRSTARLGKPFVKTYREERQPVWHVVADRSPTMRFGTRRRLKAAQAARMEVLICHAAAELGLAVGATVWDEHDIHLPARHGQGGMLELVRALTAPCPPVSGAGSENRWLARLHALRAELPRGAQVWIVSDAQGLDEYAAPGLLALASWVSLRLVRIHDPSEAELPAVGRALFEDLSSGALQWLDGSDPQVRRRLHERWQEQRTHQDEQLRHSGIRALDLATPVDDLIAEIARHG